MSKSKGRGIVGSYRSTINWGVREPRTVGDLSEQIQQAYKYKTRCVISAKDKEPSEVRFFEPGDPEYEDYVKNLV